MKDDALKAGPYWPKTNTKRKRAIRTVHLNHMFWLMRHSSTVLSVRSCATSNRTRIATEMTRMMSSVASRPSPVRLPSNITHGSGMRSSRLMRARATCNDGARKKIHAIVVSAKVRMTWSRR